MRILSNRCITLSGEVNSKMVVYVNKRVRKLLRKSTVEPITVFIECDGGFVTSALGIYDILRCLPCPVIMIALSEVQSAALVIFMAAEKKFRYCHEHTMFMGHQCTISKVDGYSELVVRRATNMQEVNDQMIEVISERSGKLSPARVRSWLFKEPVDTIFYAAEAKRNGIVGKIITTYEGLIDWNSGRMDKDKYFQPVTNQGITESRMTNKARGKLR